MSPANHRHERIDLARMNRFQQLLEERLAPFGDAPKETKLIIGIPYNDESDTLGGVINTARLGLKGLGLEDGARIICAGPERSGPVFDQVEAGLDGSSGPPVQNLLLENEFEGRGWSIRALMTAASRFKAPLILLPPNLLPVDGSNDAVGESGGFSSHWIKKLHQPIEDQQDLVLARFNRHPLAHPVDSFLAFPVITAVFGVRHRQPTPGVLALSLKLIHSCLASPDMWAAETGAYGFDAWLLIRSRIEDLSICEVPLGLPAFRHEVGKLKTIFHQVAHTVMGEVARHDQFWTEREALIRPANVSGARLSLPPPEYNLSTDQLRRRFKLEFNHFDATLFRSVLPPDLRERIERQLDANSSRIALSAEEWVRILRRFLLAYKFESGFHPDDIVDGLFPFFLARLAAVLDEYHMLKGGLSSLVGVVDEQAVRAIVHNRTEQIIQHQAEIFISVWPQFHSQWIEHSNAASSYLPRLGAWQFIPNVDVIVPQEVEIPGENSVWAYQVYKDQIDLYREQFRRFCSDHLGISDLNQSASILEEVERFMYRLDRLIDSDMFPYDIATFDGASKMAREICRQFVTRDSFRLTAESASNMILQAPPFGLITAFDAGNSAGLLQKCDPLDALGLAALTDRLTSLHRILDIIESEAEPAWFTAGTIEPVVFDVSRLADSHEVSGSAALARLAGRVLFTNSQPGSGGKFPKLWFLLRGLKAITGVELFSQIWQGFAAEGFEFGDRLAGSIRGHWGRHVMSAHNAFENMHQRLVAERLRRYADAFRSQHPERTQAADLLEAAAGVYHLSITLPDTTFVPLSAWTWASFSNRGGIGGPTPLSSLVERDWATRDFLDSYLERTGRGDAAATNRKIFELIGKEMESEDLREHLFGIEADPDTLVVLQTPEAESVPARKMTRPLDRPMFEPVKSHDWESRYVLNSAAVRLDGRVYILYRAFGVDEVSRIGLAWSDDGIHLAGRLDRPIFEPANENELGGCEDPRVVVIDGRLWMLYTAWDRRVAQIALASIEVDDFVAGRHDRWQRHGLGFPGLANKDAVLYPEKFNGRFALYHRLDPNMWISYLDELTCPWPRDGQQIMLSPRAGMMWDGVKIGAGAQPIKTTHGWLNIYHGVDFERSYRLGVLFTALDDPARIIYRSPNPVLEPETPYELGDADGSDSWVPHVVFTCGALPAEDKDIIGPDDEILVYYGAADTVMGVAKATVRDMVPIIDSLNPKI